MTPLVAVLVGRFEDSQKLENEYHKGTESTEDTIDSLRITSTNTSRRTELEDRAGNFCFRFSISAEVKV